MIKRIFTVDGKPFFPLGGQARNSSGYNDAESETAFRAVKLIGGNTLEIPVYWDQVEPQEGAFDFASVDALLASARRHGLKLVLLWFGTWKNGDMDYAPAWVKTNPARFQRVISPTGKDCWVLSSHCAANLEADRSAFVALCDHLKAARWRRADGHRHPDRERAGHPGQRPRLRPGRPGRLRAPRARRADRGDATGRRGPGVRSVASGGAAGVRLVA